MNVPVPLKIAALAVGATLFYTYVGQLVPQKEVHPPEVVEISKDVGPAEMVEIGKGIFEGKGICATCHTIGKSGSLRFPDLQGIGARAASQIPGYTGLDYLAESLYEPDVFLVSGFNKGMPIINKPPIGLTDDEILTVIAYLQSLGSTPSVTMETKLVYTGGALGGGDGGEAPAEDAVLAEASDDAVPAGPLATFGCTGCHFVDQPGELQGPSLYDVGNRLTTQDIMARTSAHTTPLPNAAQLTLAEVRSLAESLSQRKGEG